MSFLPRDFLETREGLVFAVVDSRPDRAGIPAFLRYVPDNGGRRKLATAEANLWLRRHAPAYLQFSVPLDASLHAVPGDRIHAHHLPRKRVAALRSQGPGDALEGLLLRLVRLLEGQGVDGSTLGVTGSVLIGEQGPGSDLDLVVYGREHFFRAQAAMARLMEDGALQGLDEAAWRDAHQRRACALDFAEYVRHERRKFNKGLIEGTKFDLALVAETGPGVSDGRWRKEGLRLIRARVTDASAAFEHPAKYRLDHPEYGAVLSFTHTYVGQALAGEWVEVCGTLERSDEGEARLVVGSDREAAGQYVRVLWDDQG